MSLALLVLFAVFILLLLIDAPIAIALALSSVAYLLVGDVLPLMVVAQRMVAGIDSFTLLAIRFSCSPACSWCMGGSPRGSSIFARQSWASGRVVSLS